MKRGWLTAMLGLMAFTMAEARAGSVFLESGGQVVGEAEHFMGRAEYEGQWDGLRQWLVVPDESSGLGVFQNARGGEYIQALPDRGPIDFRYTPTVDYRVRITTPGEYQLHLRWDGLNKGSDSIYAGIVEQITDWRSGSVRDWYQTSFDPTPGTDADFSTFPWDGFGGKGTNNYDASPKVPMTWNLAAGDYTLRLRMREDGVAIDTWILQLSGMPAPTGWGPAESAIVPLPAALPGALGLLGLIGLTRWFRSRGRER